MFHLRRASIPIRRNITVRMMCKTVDASKTAVKDVSASATEANASTAAKTVSTTGANTEPIKTKIVKKSTLGQRLGAFSMGCATTAIALGYFIYEDIWNSAEKVDRSIDALRGDIVESNEQLRKRIAKLESKVL